MKRFSTQVTVIFAWASVAWASALAAAAGCAVDPDDIQPEIHPVGPPMNGLHVVGNTIQNADGLTVHLRGINRSGTEYRCVQSGGIFDGPSDVLSIQAMATWKINAVRVPLNESCWLGTNGSDVVLPPDTYKQAIRDYVGLLEAHHIVPILDLHWVGPGTARADRLQPMPDLDHAPAFWADVATTFANDDAVVYELFNEPFPDRNRDTDAGWQCWRDGCMANLSVPAGGTSVPYMAVGMQGLVDAVRSTGARNLLLLGGLQYSNALSQWQTYAPADPAASNLAPAWHVYNFNACANATCWDGVPATLSASYPIVVTEFGQNDCGGGFVEPFMQWLDGRGIGYLAWSWNAYGPCQPAVNNRGGQPWPLVTNFVSGAPNGGYAMAVYNHLVQRAAQP